MSESKLFRGHRDRSRIDINDPLDVEYVHHQFPWFSHDKIRETIRKYGPDREVVQAVLERSGSDTLNAGDEE